MKQHGERGIELETVPSALIDVVHQTGCRLIFIDNDSESLLNCFRRLGLTAARDELGNSDPNNLVPNKEGMS